jgi:Skp family chaperone for outer membrane proteins
MKTNLRVLATLALAITFPVANAQTTSSGTTAKKKAHAAAPKGPSVQSQIDSLRNDMQNQIQTLKQQLADKDAQLQQAQQSAAAAQQAAQQAQAAAQQAQQANGTNTEAVSSLQGAVTDLKTNNASLAQTIQDSQKQTKAAIESPDAFHFKGVTLSPTGSFLEAATVWRSRATGSDINTPFNSLPYNGADNAYISEFFGSGRQSRVALLAEGKLSNWTMRGYWEADWLGTGVTSNNNESNSYVMRQRQLWAQGESSNGFIFTAGQQWSLATENKTGIVNRTELLPQTIDPAYNVGFVWERQYGARVVKSFANKQLWAGISVENPQTLTPSCQATGNTTGGTALACPNNYLIGSTGTGGGLYNGAGGPTATGGAGAPLTTYSYNLAPDLIAKLVYEKPGFGHYELFGIARFYRDRVYPNATSTTVPTGTGAYNDSAVGGGIGGSLYVPIKKYVDVGLSGLWGDGTNRYGGAQLPDVTVRPDGQLAILHGFSALGTLVFHATPRLDIYTNYGTDYAFRRYFATQDGTVGYGSPLIKDSGCGVELAPGTSPQVGYQPTAPGSCGSPTKDVQEFTAGYWYDFYKGPKGRFRQGIQYSYFQRLGWSGAGGTPSGIDNLFETSFRYYLP